MSTNNCIHNLVEDEQMGHRVCTKCGQVNRIYIINNYIKIMLIGKKNYIINNLIYKIKNRLWKKTLLFLKLVFQKSLMVQP